MTPVKARAIGFVLIAVGTIGLLSTGGGVDRRRTRSRWRSMGAGERGARRRDLQPSRVTGPDR